MITSGKMAAATKNGMAQKKKALAMMSVSEFVERGLDTSSSDGDSEPEIDAGKKMSAPKSKKETTPLLKSKADKPSERDKTPVLKSTAGKAKTLERKSGKMPDSMSKMEKQKMSNAGAKKMPASQSKTETKEKKDKSKDRKEKETLVPNMKKSMQRLKETDPEFYEFLQKEDKELLAFDDDDESVSMDDDDDDYSDDGTEEKQTTKSAKAKKKQEEAATRAFEKKILEMSSGASDSDDSEEEGGGGGRIHKPPEKLQVASDEEDWDDDIDAESDDSADRKKKRKTSSGTLVTMAMVKAWTSQMQASPSPGELREIVSALAAAVRQAGSSDGGVGDTQYRVEGSTVFNAVIRLCLTEVVPALQSILGIPSLADAQQTPSQKNKRWRSVRGTVKNYCALILQLIGELAEPSMINIVLKHAHKLVVCYAAFVKLAKTFMKKMIGLWSSGEETTRVLAFLCINKLVRLTKDSLLEPCLKQMYLSYVSNCKFVSPTSLPLISFMQHSLVEVLRVDEAVAYQHAFLYIRQLAIHLRNAVMVKKKELVQAVYNWQYVLSLGLWTRLLSTAHPSATLQPLIYPLTQTIIGTIRLMPTARFYPLRFHCVRYLTMLSGATNTFIPVLPYLLEVLEQTDFNKRPKSGSLKNLNVSTILKFSKPQLQERAFKDTLIDQLYELLLDNLSVHSHTLAFPELIVPMVLQLKDFLKKCKVASYCKQLKQIVEKSEETAKVITARRKASTFSLTDTRAVDQWEWRSQEEGTPLSKFYSSWRKLRDRQLQQDIANKEQVSGAAMELPEIIRRKGPLKATDEEKQAFDALFADDSDDGIDDNIRFLPKAEKAEAMKKKQDMEPDEEDYSDFDSDELEQLAKSASEGESSEDDEQEKTNKKQPPKATKRTQPASGVAKSARTKHAKLDAENDMKDIVEEFQMSDSDSP